MNDLPLFNHALDESTAFCPEDLVEAVRQQRGMGDGSIPPLGVLEFDGDLIDKLIARGEVRRCADWPCFHTDMWLWPKDEPRCGIVARTIGGPYTVLIAEQMAVCGMKAVVGLASAGRIGRALPLPGIVVAERVGWVIDPPHGGQTGGQTVSGHTRDKRTNGVADKRCRAIYPCECAGFSSLSWRDCSLSYGPRRRCGGFRSRVSDTSVSIASG